MTRRHLVELTVLVVAVGTATVFAVLWEQARSSSHDDQQILVLDLSTDPDHDANMPYPIRVLDHDGKNVAGVDHHGIPQALRIDASRYPIVVVAGFGECRSKQVDVGSVAVVEVSVRKDGCTAWQIA